MDKMIRFDDHIPLFKGTPTRAAHKIVKGASVFFGCFLFAILLAWLYSTTPGPTNCDATAAKVTCHAH